MKNEHLLLLIVLAAAAVGGVFWWKRRESAVRAANHAAGPTLPPSTGTPIGTENMPTEPKKGLSTKDAVALGATVGCTAYFGGVSAPACAIVAPMATDALWQGAKQVRSWF